MLRNYIKFLILSLLFTQTLFAINVNSLPITQVTLQTGGHTVVQNNSGAGGYNFDYNNEVVNITKIKINANGNNVTLDNFATHSISITNLLTNYNSVYTINNGQATSSHDAKFASEVKEVLSSTDIRDYLGNDDEGNDLVMLNIMYDDYVIDSNDYIFFQERLGNSPFSLIALDSSGHQIMGSVKVNFNHNGDKTTLWDTGYNSAGDISGGIGCCGEQNQYFGIVKISNFNIGSNKIHGFKYIAHGADAKFYALGANDFNGAVKDFGDAPDIGNYHKSKYAYQFDDDDPKTKVAERITPNVYLGSSVTTETTGHFSINADGDSDDAITNPNDLIVDKSTDIYNVQVNVVNKGSGTYTPPNGGTPQNLNVDRYLSAWIDWNDNHIFENSELTNGTPGSRYQVINNNTESIKSFIWDIPNGLSAGDKRVMRIRLTECATDWKGDGDGSDPYVASYGDCSNDTLGNASFGEIEDYVVTVGGGTSSPFTCSQNAYLFSGSTDAYEINLSNGTSTPLSNNFNPNHINAIGYNVKDNLIWGWEANTDKVVKIDANFNVASYDVAGLPKLPYQAGDVSKNGILYLNRSDDKIYKVDLNSGTPVYLGSIDIKENGGYVAVHFGDMAINPIDNMIYSINENGDACHFNGCDNHLYRIDPNSGAVTDLGDTGISEAIDFHSYIFDKDGNMYFYGLSGNIFKIDLSASSSAPYTASIFSTTTNKKDSGDGAKCPNSGVVQPPNTQLVAEYRFDKCDLNNLTAEDSSGNNQNGTVTGSVDTSSEAKIARSGHFKGGAVDTTLSGLNTSNGAKTSVSFWMNWNGSEDSGGGQNWGQIPISWGSGSNTYNIHIDLVTPNTPGSGLKIGFNTYNADNYGASIAGYSSGWHHIVAIFENGNAEHCKLYIDGAQKSLSQSPGRSPKNNRAYVKNQLRIGGLKNGDQPYAFKDYLDEVKIYNGELSSAEINTIYNNENAGKNYDGSNRNAVNCNQIESICYAIDDTKGYLYKVYMNPNASPLPLATKIDLGADGGKLNGEGGAYNSNDGLVYAFNETNGGPKLYSINPSTKTVSLIKHFTTMNKNVTAATFGNGLFYIIARDKNTGIGRLYTIKTSDWSIVTSKDLNGDITMLSGLAINNNGNAYGIIDHSGGHSKLYTVDLTTAKTTYKFTLPDLGGRHPGAEGISFAKDGNLYMENSDNELTSVDDKIYKIDINTGALTPAAQIPHIENMDIEGLSCNVQTSQKPPVNPDLNNSCETPIPKRQDLCRTDSCFGDNCNRDSCSSDSCSQNSCSQNSCSEDIPNSDTCTRDSCRSGCCGSNNVINGGSYNPCTKGYDSCRSDSCSSSCTSNTCNTSTCTTDTCTTNTCTENTCITDTCSGDSCHSDNNPNFDVPEFDNPYYAITDIPDTNYQEPNIIHTKVSKKPTSVNILPNPDYEAVICIQAHYKTVPGLCRNGPTGIQICGQPHTVFDTSQGVNGYTYVTDTAMDIDFVTLNGDFTQLISNGGAINAGGTFQVDFTPDNISKNCFITVKGHGPKEWNGDIEAIESNSTDPFAIRPDKFVINLDGKDGTTNPLKAGNPFTLKISALDFLGNPSTSFHESINSNDDYQIIINDKIYGNDTDHGLKLDGNSFVLGVLSASTTYNETGELNITINEKDTNIYAMVDIGDGTSQSDIEIQPDTKELRVIPDHFDVDYTILNENPTAGLTYFANNLATSSSTIDLTITAKNLGNAPTARYTNSAYAKDGYLNIYLNSLTQELKNPIDLNWTIDNSTSDSSSFNFYTNGTQDFNISIKKADFTLGILQNQIKSNLNRERNYQLEPLRLYTNQIYIEDNDTIKNVPVSTNLKFADYYYVRAHAPDQTSSTTVLDAKMYYEAYCKGCNKSIFTQVNKPESTDSVYWYQLPYYVDLNYNSGSTALFPDLTISNEVQNGMKLTVTKQPHSNKITYTPLDFLLYNKFNANVLTHNFNVQFSTVSSKWSGKGELGSRVDMNVSNRPQSIQQMEW